MESLDRVELIMALEEAFPGTNWEAMPPDEMARVVRFLQDGRDDELAMLVRRSPRGPRRTGGAAADPRS